MGGKRVVEWRERRISEETENISLKPWRRKGNKVRERRRKKKGGFKLSRLCYVSIWRNLRCSAGFCLEEGEEER